MLGSETLGARIGMLVADSDQVGFLPDRRGSRAAQRRDVSNPAMLGMQTRRKEKHGSFEETTLQEPQHVAMIMDGNGRWAKARFLPRVAGHARGVRRVRDVVECCIERNIRFLTLFAFSTENWKRPEEEVSDLMGLFASALEGEINKLWRNGVRLRVIGDLGRFSPRLQTLIASAEARTATNERLTLTVAANYGGQWDIQQAFRGWLRDRLATAEDIQSLPDPGDIDLRPYLSMGYAPDPDLVIRTGGEQRISNFLLWQTAYAELYFTDTLWPDFDGRAMGQALAWFAQRERRFGQTGQQVRIVAC
jgi:undecaprenyl diphosphate synthase